MCMDQHLLAYQLGHNHTLGLIRYLILGLLGFTGCEPPESAATKPRIALVMKSLANEFFLTMENGAKAHQQAHADQYELIANGIKDELDVGKQIDLVEQMIAQRVSAIVIAPADSKALIPVCRKAQQAGIVVVNIDNQFDHAVLKESGVRFPFVGPDNRQGARAVGDYLASKLKPGDGVATSREPGHTKRHQEIIATTLMIVQETGLCKLTRRKIAKRLSVTESALYRYFPTRMTSSSPSMTIRINRWVRPRGSFWNATTWPLQRSWRRPGRRSWRSWPRTAFLYACWRSHTPWSLPSIVKNFVRSSARIRNTGKTS